MIRIYLAGAIDSAPDGGAGWRYKITPMFRDVGLEVFNPCVETDGKIAKKLGWEEFSISRFNNLKYTDRPVYDSICAETVDEDLKALVNSDGLLVYYDEYVKNYGVGTHGEITLARFIQMPIGFILGPGIVFDDILFWSNGCIQRRGVVYPDMDAFVKVMHLVGKSKKKFFPDSPERVFIDG